MENQHELVSQYSITDLRHLKEHCRKRLLEIEKTQRDWNRMSHGYTREEEELFRFALWEIEEALDQAAYAFGRRHQEVLRVKTLEEQEAHKPKLLSARWREHGIVADVHKMGGQWAYISSPQETEEPYWIVIDVPHYEHSPAVRASYSEEITKALVERLNAAQMPAVVQRKDGLYVNWTGSTIADRFQFEKVIDYTTDQPT